MAIASRTTSDRVGSCSSTSAGMVRSLATTLALPVDVVCSGQPLAGHEHKRRWRATRDVCSDTGLGDGVDVALDLNDYG